MKREKRSDTPRRKATVKEEEEEEKISVETALTTVKNEVKNESSSPDSPVFEASVASSSG